MRSKLSMNKWPAGEGKVGIFSLFKLWPSLALLTQLTKQLLRNPADSSTQVLTSPLALAGFTAQGRPCWLPAGGRVGAGSPPGSGKPGAPINCKNETAIWAGAGASDFLSL